MTTDNHPQSHRRGLGYLNAVLTAIAVCLGLLTLDRLAIEPQTAHAGQSRTGDGPGRAGGLVSAADQRKMIIAELRKLNKRVTALDKTIKDGGLSVKVTEMPEIELPEQE